MVSELGIFKIKYEIFEAQNLEGHYISQIDNGQPVLVLYQIT